MHIFHMILRTNNDYLAQKRLLTFINEEQNVFYKIRCALLNIYMNFRLQSLMTARVGPKHLGKYIRLQLPPLECGEEPS
jgi:hypothetical protein